MHMIEKIMPWLGAIKAAAVAALLLGVFWFGHKTGAQGVQVKWDAETAARANAEKSAVLDRVAQNQQIFRQQEITNQNITKAHDDELNQVRAAIAGAPRVRPGAALCSGFAAAAEANSASGSNAADTGGGVLSPEMDGAVKSLIMEMEQAAAAGRSCQRFITQNGLAPS